MTITARQAAYAAIALNFLRKTIRKVSQGRPGEGRPRFVVVYPYVPESAIVGSFPSREEAELFADRLMRYSGCSLNVEDLDDWQEISCYDQALYSAFRFQGNTDHWDRVMQFIDGHGQTPETTDPEAPTRARRMYMLRHHGKH